MHSQTSKFLSLSLTERSLVCTAAALLLTSRLLLPVAGLDRTYRYVDRLARVLPPYTMVHDPDRIPWALAVADSALPVTCACLANAIVGERLLGHHGHRAHIRLGVDTRGEFEAHAWVEHSDEIVIGEVEEHARFQLLSTYGS